MDARCRIELFGKLRVLRGEQVHTRFRTHKAAALLAYLALHLHQAHPRDRLVDLFWPDMELGAGRDNLSTTLSQLRRQLEPVGTPTGSILVADRQQVRLNTEAVSTDVADFERWIRQTRQCEDQSKKAKLLLQAIDLYRGELLPGIYEDWAAREQTRCQNLFLDSLLLLAQLLEATGQIPRALATAQQATLSDAYAEEGYLAQMRLLLRLGKPSAALQTYEDMEQLFQRELGARPSAAIRQMAERIRQDPDAVVRMHAEATRQARPSANALAISLPPEETAVPLPAPAADSPPPAAPTLPLQLTRFFGRARERQQVANLLQAQGTRLVSLLGPGGVGKTRLALEVAGQVTPIFANRVWFVPLADIPDVNLIASALAHALRLPPTNEGDPLERVAAFLGDAPCLLVLDNMEHLLRDTPGAGKNDNPALSGSTGLLRLLLQRVPGLVCLATSRQPLRLGGEHEFPLPPLPVPTTEEEGSEEETVAGRRKTEDGKWKAEVGNRKTEDETGTSSHKSQTTSNQQQTTLAASLLAFPSVALYVDRARAVRPDFDLNAANVAPVAQLCRRLEGMPLAIEMAAAWVKTIPPHKMLERLEHQLDLLVSRRRDLPPRHQSLRATIEWSYDLLADDLRGVFTRLSQFRGGWTLEAAEAICGVPVLHALLALQEQSLIMVEETHATSRYRMLEPLREFGLEKMEEMGQQETTARRHASWCLAFVDQAHRHNHGEAETEWMDALQRDWDNLRSALQFCLHEGADTADLETGAELAHDLNWFWMVRGNIREGRRWTDLALVLAPPETIKRLGLLNSGAMLAHIQGDLPSARTLFEASMQQAREKGDLCTILMARNNLAIVMYDMGDVEQARCQWEEVAAQAQEAHLDRYAASALCNLGELTYDAEDYEQARAYMEACLIWRRRSGDLRYLGRDLGILGKIAFRQGDNARAHAYLSECLRLRQELNDVLGIAETLDALAELALLEAQAARAIRLLAFADHTRDAAGTPRQQNEVKQFAACIATARAALSEQEYHAAWAAGLAMKPEQAVLYALEPL